MSESLPPTPDGPYHVEEVTVNGRPAWRLAGPGLHDGRAYSWDEVRTKLADVAQVMNFAWQQARKDDAT